jgi:hypothetical protein
LGKINVRIKCTQKHLEECQWITLVFNEGELWGGKVERNQSKQHATMPNTAHHFLELLLVPCNMDLRINMFLHTLASNISDDMGLHSLGPSVLLTWSINSDEHGESKEGTQTNPHSMEVLRGTTPAQTNESINHSTINFNYLMSAGQRSRY